MIQLLLTARPHASVDLQDAFLSFIEYRAASKYGPWSLKGVRRCLSQAKDSSDAALADAFRESIRKGWQGIFVKDKTRTRPVVGFSMDPKVWAEWRP